MKIDLIPYTYVDGIPTFRDSEIMGLYDQMEADGTVKDVFSDGIVKTAQDFLTIMKSGANHLYIILVDGERSGVFWLNRFEARFARVHWCLFSNQWGKNVVGIGRKVRRTIMSWKDKEGEFLFDMLMGITPSSNRAAVKYLKKCGGVVLGELPNASMKEGKSISGIIMYYIREG